MVTIKEELVKKKVEKRKNYEKSILEVRKVVFLEAEVAVIVVNKVVAEEVGSVKKEEVAKDKVIYIKPDIV